MKDAENRANNEAIVCQKYKAISEGFYGNRLLNFICYFSNLFRLMWGNVCEKGACREGDQSSAHIAVNLELCYHSEQLVVSKNVSTVVVERANKMLGLE